MVAAAAERAPIPPVPPKNFDGRKRHMEIEELRQKLLEETYAGAFAGMPAMLLDEDRIRQADEEELLEIARERGLL